MLLTSQCEFLILFYHFLGVKIICTAVHSTFEGVAIQRAFIISYINLQAAVLCRKEVYMSRWYFRRMP